MNPEELGVKTRQLYEHLRNRISGCYYCETGHHPESHIPSSFPASGSYGQEITWVCKNGHRHYMDVLFGARSIHLEPEGIRTENVHQQTGFLIRVTDPDQPEPPDEETSGPRPFTFTVQARSEKEEGAQWWAYDGPEEEKREILHQFMEVDIYARNDGQGGLYPELAEVPPEATTLIEAVSFSLDCQDADELRRLQAANLEDQADDWEELNLHRELGEEVVRAAQTFRGEPVRLILEVDGRQAHILISLPPPDGMMDSGDDRVVKLFDWPSVARARATQSGDAYERGWEEEEEDGPEE